MDGGGVGFVFVLKVFDGDWIVGGNIGALIWGEYWIGGVEEFGGKDGGLLPFGVEWDIGGKIWKRKTLEWYFRMNEWITYGIDRFIGKCWTIWRPYCCHLRDI